jgi:hypothetical protein
MCFLSLEGFMRMTRASLFAVSIYLCSPSIVYAQQPPSPTEQAASAPNRQPENLPTKEKSIDVATTPTSQAKNVIQTAMEGMTDKSLGKNALSVLKELLDDTRSAQARVYVAVRTINRNLDALTSKDSDTVEKAGMLTAKLMAGSYSDALFQSRNLGDQVKTRLANLVADSLLMQKNDSESLRDDFVGELSILTNRFVESRRFSAGIGLEYIYLPKVTYTASTAVDLSEFQASGVPVSGQTGFQIGFDKQATPATRIVASGSGMDVAITIPAQSQMRQVVTSVRQAEVSSPASSQDLMYRTTLTSKIKPEVDACLSFSVLYAAGLIKGAPEDERERQRISYHLGVGMTGFRVDEVATTEVRSRTDSTKAFNDLSPIGSTVSTRRLSFKQGYWNADARFLVSDESQLAVSYRQYFHRSGHNELSPRVSGYALSIYFVWLPTFGW